MEEFLQKNYKNAGERFQEYTFSSLIKLSSFVLLNRFIVKHEKGHSIRAFKLLRNFTIFINNKEKFTIFINNNEKIYYIY